MPQIEESDASPHSKALHMYSYLPIHVSRRSDGDGPEFWSLLTVRLASLTADWPLLTASLAADWPLLTASLTADCRA